ncbi:hypothetical protein SLEP1_g27502 [Rubroshorea leprosula]|uniref:Uncharacterized protein n=1 Tax=Rubroshorea leprosula TaxID=152421 RepID=A0AAV5JZZ3_9ROSI|nr:hypothetical protein SLEP1_g27502 [Rubroshorea leprosula]
MRFQDEANSHQIDLNKLETKTLISIGTGLDDPSKGHNQADKGMRGKERLLSVVKELVNLLQKHASSETSNPQQRATALIYNSISPHPA